jgi:hypothetical protein
MSGNGGDGHEKRGGRAKLAIVHEASFEVDSCGHIHATRISFAMPQRPLDAGSPDAKIGAGI